jgi:hypothetical protein
MAQERTCGEGLANRSALPAKFGALFGSLADNLEVHMRALDPSDADARQELEAYLRLANGYRDIAGRLSAIAREMAGYRGLPAACHDMTVISDAKTRTTFEQFAEHEEEVAALLQEHARHDRRMLLEMRGSA